MYAGFCLLTFETMILNQAFVPEYEVTLLGIHYSLESLSYDILVTKKVLSGCHS